MVSVGQRANRHGSTKQFTGNEPNGQPPVEHQLHILVKQQQHASYAEHTSAAAILPSNSAASYFLYLGLEKELQQWSRRVELPAAVRQSLLSSTSLSFYSVFTGVVINLKTFFLKPLGD